LWSGYSASIASFDTNRETKSLWLSFGPGTGIGISHLLTPVPYTGGQERSRNFLTFSTSQPIVPRRKEGAMPLFGVAVIEHPTPEEKEKGKEETLLVEPKWLVAKSADIAKVLAGRELPAEVNVDRIEVLVRPF
jgi:hypothetical protein